MQRTMAGRLQRNVLSLLSGSDRSAMPLYLRKFAEGMTARPFLLLCIFPFVGVNLAYYYGLGISLIVQMSLLLTGMVVVRMYSRDSVARYLLLSAACLAVLLSVRLAWARTTALLVGQEPDTAGVWQCLTTENPARRGDVPLEEEELLVVSNCPSGSNGYHKILFRFANGVEAVSFLLPSEELKPGRKFLVSGTLVPTERKRNPGGFDEADYYARQGIYWKVTLSGISSSDGPVPAVALLLIGAEEWMESLRGHLRDLWSQILPEAEAALLTGMMIGDTSGMDSNMKNQFKLSNLSHLTAVSGSNVALFLLPFSFLFTKAGWNRKTRRFLSLGILVFFGFLTGWSASVSRAIFMTGSGILYGMIFRKQDALNGLFAAGLLLILASPAGAVDIGFQLSFGASLGMILMAKPLLRKLGTLPLPRGLVEALSSSLAAWVGMLPFLCELDSKISIPLFAVNLLAILVAEAITLLALPLLLVHVPFYIMGLQPDLLQVIYAPLSGLLYGMRRISEQGAMFSYSAALLRSYHPFVIVAVIFAAVYFLLPRSLLRNAARKIVLMVVTLAVVFQTLLYLDRPEFTVVFADVGQGDCILLLTRSGRSVLIDGGNRGMGRNVVSPLLDAYQVVSPDICIVTHLDSDHMQGLIELVEMGRIHTVYTCLTDRIPSGEMEETAHPLYQFAEEGKLVLLPLRKNDRIEIGDRTCLSVLWPEAITDGGKNEDSVVLLAENDDTGILLTGDIGERTERALLAFEETRALLAERIDFLKIGHHGSRFSTSEMFLRQMTLEAAFICVGRNLYGHPSTEVLERLEEYGIPYFRTDESGAVILEKKHGVVEIFEYCA